VLAEQTASLPPASIIAPTEPSATLAPGLPDGVVAEIPLDNGVAPLSVIEAAGSIWVSSHRASTLYRIDPTSNEVSARLDIGQEACSFMAYGFGLIWITQCDDSTHAVVVDPVQGAMVGTFQSAPGENLGFTSDAVWTAQPSGSEIRAVRIDPATLMPEPALTTGAAAGGDNYAFVNDGLYVTYSETPRISKLDPSNGAELSSVPLPPLPGDIPTIGTSDHAIWLMGDSEPTLVRFDTATSTVSEFTLPGWEQTSGYRSVAPISGLGGIWMRISDSAIARIDPETGQVTATYPAGPGGGDPAIAFGSLWVANFNSDTVWREQIDR
jgi:streptogramin lyase